MKRNYVTDILLENAETYSEKTKIWSLTEAEAAVVNDKMIGNLYQSALKRKDIDFDAIPQTKGDIKKFHGYDNMVGTLNSIELLAKKFGIKIIELNIVNEALSNLRANKVTFEKAYALDNGFLKMYYQTLCCACIEATSLILASYAQYTRTPNNIEFSIKKGKGISGNIALNALTRFNKSVKRGEFGKFAKGLLDNGRENLVGTVGGLGVGGLIALGVTIVPILRELIFYFYESRMRISEYLDQQVQYLEMNKFRLNASSMPANERNAILNKQKAAIEKLEKLSDKIVVNHQIAEKQASNKIKQDNKQWNMNSLSDNNDGFLFM